MFWILGSKSKKIKPIIRSQNPDIRYLNQVLLSSDAIQALRATNDLELAYDRSQDGNDVFHQAIVESQINIQKALAKISYYQGDEDQLKTVMNLADSADSLFEMMKEKRNRLLGKENKRTID